MLFMNNTEIEVACYCYRQHPILGPATRTLRSLEYWADMHSDGWHSWPKPARAAKQLMELIQEGGAYRIGMTPEEAYRRALRPIKAFRTRHGADFVIEEA